MIRCPTTTETSLIFKNDKEKHNLKIRLGTSLMVQWLRLDLPKQGAWVQSLVRGLRSHMLQFSSVAQSYLTLCDPKDCSMSGLPVHQ